MARYTEPTPEQEAAYHVWVAERSPQVRAVAERFDPWSLYRLTTTGHRVIVKAFNEAADGSVTLRVGVHAQFNAVMFEYDVFGIPASELEPCPLPDSDEIVGAALTQDEARTYMDVLRKAIHRQSN